MGDSDQPLSEYLAQPGGGGAVLPSKIQQALHDALANALDVKSAQEVQGFGPEVFVGLYEATVDEEDYLPAYAKIIERWAGNAPPQKRPVSNPTDAKAAEGKSKGAVDDDDDLASLRGGGPGGTETKFDLMNADLAKMGFTTGMQGTAFDATAVRELYIRLLRCVSVCVYPRQYSICARLYTHTAVQYRSTGQSVEAGLNARNITAHQP